MSNPEIDSLNLQNQQIFEALVVKDTLAKLPEYLFVQNFLPYFCGELDISKNDEVIPYWYAIAGSPTKEVEIIDESGKSLFVVPSLTDTSIIDPSKEKGRINFAEIVHLAKLYSNQSPVAGENFINTQLADKFYKLTAKSKVFGDNEKRWLDIFVRYGKIKELSGTDATVDTSTKMSDDEIEF